MYDEGLFSKEEFQQIKNILGVSTIEKIPFQKNIYKSNEEVAKLNNEGKTQKAGIIIAIALLAVMIVSGFFYFLKRKTK